MNSGDPTGFGMAPTSYSNGLRSTASTSYLSSPPSNLSIITDSPVAKILFDNSKKAVGIQTIAGETYHASKEVVISAGAIDTPKILLLSGVGPEKELARFSIPVIRQSPGVGQHLIDHALVTTTLLRKDRNLPIDHDFHGTTGMQAPMAWLSNTVVKASKEFQDLDEDTKQHLLKVPTYEFLTTPVNLAQYQPERENAELITFFIANMNSLSEGSVTLASADPNVAPVIDLNYLSHPYDRRVFIEGLRKLIEFSKMPAFEAVTEKRVEGPDGDSDEALLEHCKKVIGPVWHFGGTCRMGKDEESVVDKEFKVRGVKGLRVVDHSVAPLMTNNHTQTTAYLIVS
jgi:choline dehydrogenase-like flavoprotein